MYPLRVLHLVIIDLISCHLLNALWFQHPTAWSYYGSRSWCFWQERDPNIYDRVVVEFMISSSFEEYMVPDKTYYSWMTQQEPSYCLNQSWLCFLESKKPVKYSDHNYIGVLQHWTIPVFAGNRCWGISSVLSLTILHLTWPSNQCTVQNNKHILSNSICDQPQKSGVHEELVSSYSNWNLITKPVNYHDDQPGLLLGKWVCHKDCNSTSIRIFFICSKALQTYCLNSTGT